MVGELLATGLSEAQVGEMSLCAGRACLRALQEKEARLFEVLAATRGMGL